jgi:hypothetical protein
MAGLSGAAPVYASVDDLKVYVGSEEAPAEIENADDLLAEASAHVRAATRAAVYATDAQQFPIVQRLRDAMHDATIVQAAELHAIGWTRGTTLASGKPGIASKSLGGASVTYEAGGGASGAARRALVGGSLTNAARQYLEDAGLLTTAVQAAGGAYARPLHRVRGLA